MNFTMCQQSPGQWLMLKGIARRYELKQGQYGPYALGDLEDQTGQREKMMFGGNSDFPLPEQSLLNIPCIYNVRWDANKQSFKASFKAFSNGQPQAAPPARGPVDAVPYKTSYPPGAYSQGDGRNESIERQCVVKAVAEIVASRPNMEVPDALSWCLAFHDWIATGNVGLQPDNDGPPPADDDIPFC